ncbi:hypothetical protein PNK_0140 [Candidatus Protochlamydia naegleriophila]|uniref:Serine aminopeptidase S33 domain-containing protein n=1 Tax=Candidatus Protochlamydia naegleriophila TaxID=389348 RepID=A0A0U5JAS7_9BACT|nr:alpha/beta hydrolase [Candidatus Protochlamydia naegleriophila]CUI15778.1 hypothetical protein PNK_0140 [Candidatus Protochlamydia naegleriophila]
MGISNDSIQSAYFKSDYNYGSDSRSIKPKNAIAAFVNDVSTRMIKTFVYPGASFLKGDFINPERMEKAREQLLGIGGRSVTMETPDGDKIDGMHLRAKDFKALIDKYCDYQEEDNGDGTVNQFLTIKAEYCSVVKRQSFSDQSSFDYMQPNAEADQFIRQSIKALGIINFPSGELSLEPPVRGYRIELGNVRQDLKKIEERSEGSHPTALICPGSGMSYAAYKGLAASYLLRGIDVMMVDVRGYGKSGGSPTAYKTKLDVETAYQYLSRELGIKNEDMIVHGHCLGGGPASDLAARRKGVNLILDRTFAEYREVARERFPIIKKLVHHILPSIVDYNNAANLNRVQGHIGIVMAIHDTVIHSSQIMKLIDNLPYTRKGQEIKLMDFNGEHTGSWTDDAVTSRQFNQFLEKTGLRQRVF